MKKKLIILSLLQLLIALLIFIFSYFLYHFVAAGGIISSTWMAEPDKPMLALLFSILGVNFLFGGIVCLLIALIFFSNKNK